MKKQQNQQVVSIVLLDGLHHQLDIINLPFY